MGATAAQSWTAGSFKTPLRTSVVRACVGWCAVWTLRASIAFRREHIVKLQRSRGSVSAFSVQKAVSQQNTNVKCINCNLRAIQFLCSFFKLVWVFRKWSDKTKTHTQTVYRVTPDQPNYMYPRVVFIWNNINDKKKNYLLLKQFSTETFVIVYYSHKNNWTGHTD